MADLSILDGEILLGRRVVARVVDGLPYAIEKELISMIDDYLDEDAREALVREAREDMAVDIARGDEQAMRELEFAREIYGDGDKPATRADETGVPSSA